MTSCDTNTCEYENGRFKIVDFFCFYKEHERFNAAKGAVVLSFEREAWGSTNTWRMQGAPCFTIEPRIYLIDAAQSVAMERFFGFFESYIFFAVRSTFHVVVGDEGRAMPMGFALHGTFHSYFSRHMDHREESWRVICRVCRARMPMNAKRCSRGVETDLDPLLEGHLARSRW